MRAAETGKLHVTQHVIEVLRGLLEDLPEMISYDLECMAKLRAGDLGYCALDSTPAESLAQSAKHVRGLIDEMAACDSLFAKATR